MQPPTKAENIYPRTKENIRYIFQHFFPKEKHSIIDDHTEYVFENRGLELNQIEFVAKISSLHYDHLRRIQPKRFLPMATVYNLVSAAFYGFPKMSNNSQSTIREIKEYFNSVNAN